MPTSSYVNNDSEYAEEQRQHAREEALFLYSNSLQRLDFDTVATILRSAESDPVLEEMILGLSPYLESACLSGVGPLPERSRSFTAPHGPSDGATDRQSAQPTSRALRFERTEYIGEEIWPFAEDSQTLESEWREFVGATTKGATRLYALYLTAMDHFERLEYEMAEHCVDDAVHMALETDDLEAAAECMCLYGYIESAQAMYGDARALFNIGLMIINEAVREGVQVNDDLRIELQTLIARLDDRLLR